MMPRSRPLSGAAAAAILSLTLTACGSTTSDPVTKDEPDVVATPSAEAPPTPATGAKIIDITLDGDSVEPAGRRVEVEVGQPVVLRIDAAQDGELHVHSSPEQVIGYPAGQSEATLNIDQPGIVDVEDHDLDALIIQLEVN